MTFSIAGRCARTGDLGVAITSSSPAVAARCAHVRAGVGAVTTQNVTDPRLGPALLAALASGQDAASALARVAATAPSASYRQLTAVDAAGGTAAFTGAHALGVHGDLVGEGCVAAGNLLAEPGVLAACVEAFAAAASQDLEERLLRALEAGLGRGGEAGPLHSAGLLVARDQAWPLTDLRVDWSESPVADLRAAWTVWAPQREDYVTRALDPGSAPGYGVPGDQR